MIPFTLHIGQVVNSEELGKCKVRSVNKRLVKLVKLEPEKADLNNSEYWRDATDVDQPKNTTPVPSYGLRDPIHDGKGKEIWVTENTLTLVTPKDTATDPGVNDDNRSASKTWAHF